VPDGGVLLTQAVWLSARGVRQVRSSGLVNQHALGFESHRTPDQSLYRPDVRFAKQCLFGACRLTRRDGSDHRRFYRMAGRPVETARS
jgi:hypothetical protein